MANKNPTEISLMKGVACKLDDNTMFTLGYFVHTEHITDPVTGNEKTNRAASEYVYVGRIDKISDVESEIAELSKDENRIKNWTWKGLPKYNAVVYDKDCSNMRGAKWLKMRIKKIVDWPTFCKVIDGWNELKQAYNDNAKYVSADYVADDGTTVANLKEAKEQLLNLVGQNIIHKCVLKSQI